MLVDGRWFEPLQVGVGGFGGVEVELEAVALAVVLVEIEVDIDGVEHSAAGFEDAGHVGEAAVEVAVDNVLEDGEAEDDVEAVVFEAWVEVAEVGVDGGDAVDGGLGCWSLADAFELVDVDAGVVLGELGEDARLAAADFGDAEALRVFEDRPGPGVLDGLEVPLGLVGVALVPPVEELAFVDDVEDGCVSGAGEDAGYSNSGVQRRTSAMVSVAMAKEPPGDMHAPPNAPSLRRA
ncbi:MAG: hypothetical protein AAGK09_11285 [Planctomycetota bacterium]